MTCFYCADPDGEPCFPQYGPAPHRCFYLIGKPMGQSEPLPSDQWPSNFLEDPDSPGLGTYWCPYCGDGKPDSADTKPSTTADLLNLARVRFDDCDYLICHFGDLIDILPEHVENGGTYVVEHVQMTQAELDALPEFEG